MTSISDKPDPIVLHITVADVVEAFGKGLRNFQALPLYGISLGAVYAIAGRLIIFSISAFGMSYLDPAVAARPPVGLMEIRDAEDAGDSGLRFRYQGSPWETREILLKADKVAVMFERIADGKILMTT